MMGSTNFLKSLVIVTGMILCCSVFVISLLEAVEKEPEPERGIRIILNIYSGRPNPQWWLTEGPEFEKLVELIKGMKPKEKKLFEYNEWNRLGYTNFWIIPKNLEDLPFAVHIWHDKASVVPAKGKAAVQTVGVLPIYDMLASHALKTNMSPKKFFRRYLDFKAEQEKKEKEKQEK